MSRSRAKGTAFETEVVNYLNSKGHKVRRTGSADFGAADVVGLEKFTIECKNVKAMDLAGWVDQVETAVVRNDLMTTPIVVHKRARKNVSKAYVTMSLDEFVALLNS